MSFNIIAADPISITGDWFAGFVDGEGSLNIAGKGGCCQPRFRLNQRDDDTAIILAIRAFLGVGHIGKKLVNPNSKHGYIKGKPQTLINVVGADCVRVVEVLDKHPLRSKKSREYPIWREAVLDYASHLGNRWTGSRVAERSSRMKALKERLSAERVYREVA